MSIPPRRVYALSSGPSPIPRERVPQLVWVLFDRLTERLDDVGIDAPLPAVAWYERVTGELGEAAQRVWVGFTAPPGHLGGEISPVVLDGATQAAVATHHGDMATIHDSWEELFAWVRERGGHSAGYAREVHVRAQPLPEAQWVTELQLPFTGTATA